MPYIVGMSYSDVTNTYEWLRMDPTQVHSEEFPLGYIISQETPAGRTINPSQTIVAVEVSMGRRIVHMPDFTRHLTPWEEVEAQLRSLGLVPELREIYDEEIPVGYFIRSDRDPNDELSPGDPVRVFVSLGSEHGDLMTTVPSFFGLTELEASDLARENYITPSINRQETTDDNQIGRVINQSVAANTEVENWYVVQLTVGVAPAIDPDDVERETQITFAFSPGATGVFEFSYYINGVRYGQPETVDIGVRRQIRWQFTGSGSGQLYSIRVRHPETGRSGIYAVYEVDFTQDPPQKERLEQNTDILAEISVPADTPDNDDD